jgi:hypothetical protein
VYTVCVTHTHSRRQSAARGNIDDRSVGRSIRRLIRRRRRRRRRRVLTTALGVRVPGYSVTTGTASLCVKRLTAALN